MTASICKARKQIYFRVIFVNDKEKQNSSEAQKPSSYYIVEDYELEYIFNFQMEKNNKTKQKTLFLKMETATESGNPEGLIILKKKQETI